MFYPYYYYNSAMMLALLLTFFFAIYAQMKVKSTYTKYAKVQSKRGITGADVARYLLTANDITDVRVEPTSGKLSDHYDPTSKVIRLSEVVYDNSSIAAISVAAHETGHAIQDAKGYAFLRFRHSLFPLTQLSSQMAMPLFFLGLIMGSGGEFLLQLGIAFFVFAVLFQIVTLPVEFNASNRAIKILKQHNLLEADEVRPARKVLTAAALTYVAAAVTAIVQLIRLILIAQSRRDD